MPVPTLEARRLARKGSTEYDLPIAINRLRDALRHMAFGNAGLQIRTNFDIQNQFALEYSNAGTLKTLAATQAFDTGAAATIAGDRWGIALCSVTAAGAGLVTWETAAGAGYATEAAAIAAVPEVPAGNTPVGYATVLAHAAGFIAGTSALQGGTGGNVSPDTNYYNLLDPTGRIAQLLERGDEIAA